MGCHVGLGVFAGVCHALPQLLKNGCHMANILQILVGIPASQCQYMTTTGYVYHMCRVVLQLCSQPFLFPTISAKPSQLLKPIGLELFHNNVTQSLAVSRFTILEWILSKQKLISTFWMRQLQYYTKSINCSVTLISMASLQRRSTANVLLRRAVAHF